MPPTGPRFSTSGWYRGIRVAAVVCALTVLTPYSPIAGADLESMLLPGLDLGNADFEVGRWVRYLVIDEADGITDSSSVRFAVTGKEPGAFWLEIESQPIGTVDAERDLVSVLVDSGITSYADGDSLYRYVRRLYTVRGNAPAEAGDPQSLRKLTLTRPTSDADWAKTSGETVSTPMGPIVCERRELTLADRKEIPAGRVKVIRARRDRFQVWSADEVPLFHLVKCIIDRSRESRTVPPIQGIPDAGERKSRTTTILVGYGDDASPAVPHD